MDTRRRLKWALRGRHSHWFVLYEARACVLKRQNADQNQHNNPDGPYLTWTANLRCALRKQTSSCSAAFQPFCAFPELKQAEPERSRGGAAVGGGVGGDVSSSRVFVDFPKPPWGYRFHLPSPSLELRGFEKHRTRFIDCMAPAALASFLR